MLQLQSENITEKLSETGNIPAYQSVVSCKELQPVNTQTLNVKSELDLYMLKY